MAPRLINSDSAFWVMSNEADKDYLLARLTHFLGAAFHARAGFFGQMACEKYMKALTIQNDKRYADNSHKLLELAALCEPYDAYFGLPATLELLERFDMFDQVGRYGGAAKFDPISKGRPIAGVFVPQNPEIRVTGAMIWTPTHLDQLDGFVFKIRSMLDFAKVNYINQLKAILAGDDRCYFSATWTGPVPIHEILIMHNWHFKLPKDSKVAEVVSGAVGGPLDL